jgi:polysaccharide export outer membrane protein
VIGEVTRPGDYPYAIGTTVLNAIASAGGFSYRADRGDVVVTRSGLRYKAVLTTRVQPGDMIEIGERYF